VEDDSRLGRGRSDGATMGEHGRAASNDGLGPDYGDKDVELPGVKSKPLSRVGLRDRLTVMWPVQVSTGLRPDPYPRSSRVRGSRVRRVAGLTGLSPGQVPPYPELLIRVRNQETLG
jgi:hypothetical protein